jgi:phosphotransferase system enzyme I (PtsI)
VAVGPAYLLAARVDVPMRLVAREETGAELQRFQRALAGTDGQLAHSQALLEARGAHEGRDIVEMHRMLLRSSELLEEVRRLVRECRLSAESAARAAFDRLKAPFEGMTDPYFRDRRSDLEAVGDRLLRTLMGLPELRAGEGAPPGAIVVANDISPLDPFQLERAQAKGIVTEDGGRTSHAAIVARALGIPYVLGVANATRLIANGAPLVLDGRSGEILVNPDLVTLEEYEARAVRSRQRGERLATVRALPARTLDGAAVEMAANVETVAELPHALDSGAESIGLFRTELLYIERDELPSEEEQFRDAVAALRGLGGRPVTFRTLDLAPDKLPGALEMPSGRNPALGLRSIRFSLRRQDVFRAQLRALYRASAFGPIRIMFPLVSSLSELRAGRAICQEVSAELAAAGIPHDPRTPIGTMIETPSAALTADHLARECDFFSIGTNDLVQYSSAADRHNEEVDYLYRPLHPAILRMIGQVVDAAGAAGIPVSVCGDMAGDPALTWVLLGLGLRTLSMAPRRIPAVKSIVRATRLEEAERLARQALAQPSEIEVEALVLDEMSRRFPLETSE